MKYKIIFLLLIIVIAPLAILNKTHAFDSPSNYEHDKAKTLNIAPSAQGWGLSLSNPDDRDSSTLIINPNAKKIDIGDTLFLKCPKTILWVVREATLKAKFLVIYFHPSASGAVPLYLFYIGKNNIPVLSAKILHHYELDVLDKDGIARCAIADGGEEGKTLRELLFFDYNKDGISELKDNNVSAHGGVVTFYRWIPMKKRFKPAWIEKYVADSNSEELIKLLYRKKLP